MKPIINPLTANTMNLGSRFTSAASAASASPVPAARQNTNTPHRPKQKRPSVKPKSGKLREPTPLDVSNMTTPSETTVNLFAGLANREQLLPPNIRRPKGLIQQMARAPQDDEEHAIDDKLEDTAQTQEDEAEFDDDMLEEMADEEAADMDGYSDEEFGEEFEDRGDDGYEPEPEPEPERGTSDLRGMAPELGDLVEANEEDDVEKGGDQFDGSGGDGEDELDRGGAYEPEGDDVREGDGSPSAEQEEDGEQFLRQASNRARSVSLVNREIGYGETGEDTGSQGDGESELVLGEDDDDDNVFANLPPRRNGMPQPGRSHPSWPIPTMSSRVPAQALVAAGSARVGGSVMEKLRKVAERYKTSARPQSGSQSRESGLRVSERYAPDESEEEDEYAVINTSSSEGENDAEDDEEREVTPRTRRTRLDRIRRRERRDRRRRKDFRRRREVRQENYMADLVNSNSLSYSHMMDPEAAKHLALDEDHGSEHDSIVTAEYDSDEVWEGTPPDVVPPGHPEETREQRQQRRVQRHQRHHLKLQQIRRYKHRVRLEKRRNNEVAKRRRFVEVLNELRARDSTVPEVDPETESIIRLRMLVTEHTKQANMTDKVENFKRAVVFGATIVELMSGFTKGLVKLRKKGSHGKSFSGVVRQILDDPNHQSEVTQLARKHMNMGRLPPEVVLLTAVVTAGIAVHNDNSSAMKEAGSSGGKGAGPKEDDSNAMGGLGDVLGAGASLFFGGSGGSGSEGGGGGGGGLGGGISQIIGTMFGGGGGGGWENTSSDAPQVLSSKRGKKRSPTKQGRLHSPPPDTAQGESQPFEPEGWDMEDPRIPAETSEEVNLTEDAFVEGGDEEDLGMLGDE